MVFCPSMKHHFTALWGKVEDYFHTEKTALEQIKCQSIEDKMDLLTKKLEASEEHKSEYLNLLKML